MQENERGNQSGTRATLRISIADIMALRLRTRKPNIALPKLLYQTLPTHAMSLIATIPSGTPAVSIPPQNGRYPISRTFPTVEDGFVIVYAQQLNGRYEAAEVLFKGQSLDFARFWEIASRWVENTIGGLHVMPGRYAYFAPTRDQWGVILRDGGFTAFDPTGMFFELTPEVVLSRNSPLTSGVTARIPVQAGNRSIESSPQIVFARVELTYAPQPNTASAWIAFVELQRLRAIQSRPPEAIVPLFREWLRTFANECGFESWCFRRGMFFGHHMEWWGDQDRRRTLHEGIDFVEGFLPNAEVQNIPERAPVRSIADGELVAVLDDFLNKTLVVRHSDIKDADGNIFHTFLSHIQPEQCTTGSVGRGQLLGRVAKGRDARAPAHLHVTGAWIPESIHEGDITMDMISPSFMPIVLINFNSLL